MNDKKIIIGIVIISLMILGGGVLVLSSTTSSSKITASQNAKAQVDQTNYAWGDIKYDGPKASKVFKIKNDGTDVLKLSNIKTSCTCTTAQIKTETGNSPIFSMHSTSSWVGEVMPGKVAELEVIFDQRFHGPSGIGPITRLINVQTNSANRPNLEFTLTGTVVK